MPAKDPVHRKEIARLGAIAQHKKYGCLIPLEACRKGGQMTGLSQGGKHHQNHGWAEKGFDAWAEKQGYSLYKHGFPDRVMIKNDELVFVEIKGPREALNQKRIHALFKRLGLKIIVWRPQSLQRANLQRITSSSNNGKFRRELDQKQKAKARTL